MSRASWVGVIALAVGVIVAVLFAPIEVERVGTGAPDPIPIRTEQSDDIELEGAELEQDRRVAVAAMPEDEFETNSAVLRRRSIHGSFDEPGESAPPTRDCVLQGRAVCDEDGRGLPAADVHLTFSGLDEFDLGELEKRNAKTTSDGGFQFEEIAGGYATLTITASGRARTSESVVISPGDSVATIVVRVPVLREYVVRLLDWSGNPSRFDDRLRSADVLGVLGLSVSRACGAIGRIFDGRDTPEYSSRSAERESGEFKWHLEVQGTQPACVHAVLGNVVLGAEVLPAEGTELGIRIDPSALAIATAPIVLRVLDTANGSAIAGATVELSVRGAGKVRLVSGEFGAVRMDLVSSSRCTVVVRAPGYSAELVEMERPFPPAFVVRLTRGRTVQGFVKDAEGNPVESAAVEIADSIRSSGPRLGPRAKTRRDGSFRLEDVSPELHELKARELFSSSTRKGRAQIDCRGGDVRGVLITIQ